MRNALTMKTMIVTTRKDRALDFRVNISRVRLRQATRVAIRAVRSRCHLKATRTIKAKVKAKDSLTTKVVRLSKRTIHTLTHSRPFAASHS